ncbi:3-deoxy-D-manno-octulosonic acid transferase [Roseiterribacter gracilis]|uniref:3-deoxy-D-manno-octulosonic acid transferase n=1 Tax=Roseiterribacter gracilis TaxID=2812848 RepID=A0A8S8XIN7_9PROT|nr:3-deoxy-D-manno-octulosonic acid transferase [Rhodospirillales bacterium TMPK1]
MLRALYRMAAAVAAPLLLSRRLRRGKEHPTRWPERTGIASKARPHGRVLWFHAASVGESLSTLALLDEIARRAPDAHLLLTTGTVTAAELLERRLPPQILLQFMPIDRLAWVQRFLDHWRPDGVVLIESELWPNLLGELARRGVPAAIVNGRLSERSARRWARAPSIARDLTEAFRLVLAQSDGDAARWRNLGAVDVRALGNLKYASDPLPDSDTLRRVLEARDGRPAWAFVSSHEGEEQVALQADALLRAHHPDLVTVLAPRHPARADAVADLARTHGRIVSRDDDGPLGDVHVIGALGRLGAVFRAVPIACIGGSFTEIGGHNPIEPACLGAATLFGPDMRNFTEVADALVQAGAARATQDAADLAHRVAHLLTHPAETEAMGAAGRAVAARERAVLDAVADALAPVLGYSS